MAKSQRTDKADRRAVVEQLRKDQKRKERRQSLLVLLVALIVGGLIIGFAVWKAVQSAQSESRDLSSIGQSPSAAGCRPVKTEKPQGQEASGASGSHVDPGTALDYRFTPPAFGQHWGTQLSQQQMRAFFTADDRPAVEQLVHNLEHGWTILWYDETIAGDSSAVSDLKAIAKTFSNSTALGPKFTAAPWSENFGEFPDGAHVALTHWSVGGTHGNPEGQLGVWQYCDGVSGEAVQQFMHDYPSSDSPEAGAY